MITFFTQQHSPKSPVNSKPTLVTRLVLLSAFTVMLSSFTLLASEEDEEHEEISDKITLEQDYADNAGIKDTSAQAGEINQTLTLYGKTVIDASKVSQVRARFAGMIKKLTHNVGDKVAKGDVIAEIESSSSLNRYTVLAPISGTVTARFANENELADQQALLTITNIDKLWLELQVFPSQRKQVAVGDKVVISLENSDDSSSKSIGKSTIVSVIRYLLPSDNNQPFIVARVPIINKNQQLSTGLLVKANVVINHVTVDLAIENRAIQTVGGKSVVFVKTAYGYQVRPIELGRVDSQRSEVLSGLATGEVYALENSYLLKAELEKSLAADDDD